jgi:hypothetical protein
MKKIEKVPTDTVVDVLCDVCGKSTRNPDSTCQNTEFATLFAKWGYDSRKDLQAHECHMCESCYDKVVEFIKSIGGTVNIKEYPIWE